MVEDVVKGIKERVVNETASVLLNTKKARIC